MGAEEPEWMTKALQRIDDRASGRLGQTTKWGTRLAVRTTPQFLALVHRAAMARNMNVGSYIRRCVAKQLAKDFNLPFTDVVKLTPMPSPYGHRGGGQWSEGEKRIAVAVPDDGEGFGDWT